MIPIRDINPSKSYPVINLALIAVNVLVFLLEMGNHAHLEGFLFYYGLVPARYTVPEIAGHFDMIEQTIPFFSFMFLHGGFWHLLGNMWFLYIFGDNIEDSMGHFRYLLFYVLCGWASGITHFIFNLQSPIPTIGASGAIAGVMGAYFILYPKSRVLTLIPIIIIPYFIEIPAAFFLGIWFLFQFVRAVMTDPNSAGIAWWAHIGGFIFGMVLLKIFSSVPHTIISRKFQRATSRKRTPRLHVVKPVRDDDSVSMHGTIIISPAEAQKGVKKVISIPAGLKKRLFRVTIPPGVKEGTTLRLPGAGKGYEDERGGDAFLKIMIKEVS